MSIQNLYVDRSGIEGTGIKTNKSFKRGEIIARIQGEVIEFKTSSKKQAQSIPTWYGLDETHWIDPGKSIFRFLNHSCEPNAAITGTRTIRARKSIPPDSEITIDYSMTDVDELWQLEEICNCGSRKCRKIIRSIQTLPTETVRSHMPFIPKFFQKIYKQANPNATI